MLNNIVKNKNLAVLFAAAVLSVFSMGQVCGDGEADKKTVSSPVVPTNEVLKNHCENHIGQPRVEKISENVWAAIGYDLASVILIATSEGNVIVDTGMSPVRARLMKKALEEAAPKAPVIAIIYTHTHIDHVGGASVWAEDGTEIWATDIFTEHFLKQYGMFRPAESIRAMHQFGHHLDLETMPCSALGARTDIGSAMETGVMMPTRTFKDHQSLEFGGTRIELFAAPGETHDQLFVWLPGEETLIPGDNFYYSFPNLYTIRGTSPRPVRQWVKGLDKMRSLSPSHLAPCHTIPIHGKENIAKALTDYRDAIQWVHDEVVRRANRLEDIDTIAESIKLPAHLANKPYLDELYGQVDWSARAIYTNYLGWFDASPEDLYKTPSKEIAKREVELIGGFEKVIGLAKEALDNDDPRWAVHLLAKVKKSGIVPEGELEMVNKLLARSYRKVAENVANTNGRGYLLEAAIALENGPFKLDKVKPNQNIVEAVPLDLIFSIMTIRIDAEKAKDIHESVQFIFPDVDKRYNVTVRYGVVEVHEGEPLPFTPEPIATFTSDALTYREIAMGITNPTKAVASGQAKISGSLIGMIKFQNRFQKGI